MYCETIIKLQIIKYYIDIVQVVVYISIIAQKSVCFKLELRKNHAM